MKVKSHAPNFRSAFISGASSGIGKAMALLLAKKKVPLIISGRNEGELKKVLAMTAPFVQTEIYAVDLSSFEERRSLIAYLKVKMPDLIINNAGFGIYGNCLDTSLEEQRKVIEVNAVAPFEITFELAKAAVEAKKPTTILNVSSVAAEFPFPYCNTYAASKSFLSHFSIALDAEVDDSSIRILTAAPGQVETHFSQRAAGKQYKNFKQTAVMSADFAARQLWNQICNKKFYCIFDWRYRWLNQIVKLFIPFALLKKVLKKRIVKRIKS